MTSIFSRDTQLKMMEVTIGNAEKYMGQFCNVLAAYTRKTAKLRDKADMLARQLHDFACTEDPELSICMKNFSEDLAMVQDYRQAEVERLETRVVTPLKVYGEIVKNKRVELKKFSTDRNRELKELQRFEKIRLKNPADRQSISQAEVNVQRASTSANRSTRQMEDIIIDFQKQKLEDIKRIFSDFIMVEMLFHAKALEVYTHTFKNMETMDIEKDLELFRNRIQVPGPLLDNTASTTDMSHYSSLSASNRRLPQYPSSPNSSLRHPQYPSSPNSSLRHPQYPNTTDSSIRLPQYSNLPDSSLRLPQYTNFPDSSLRLPQYHSSPLSVARKTLEQPKQSPNRVLHRQREMEDDEEKDEEEERYVSEEDVEDPRTHRQSYAAEYVRTHRQK